MPDYDLGTAHGRIKIDVDDRGAQQAERSVTNLERTMQSLDRRMAAMQTSMQNVEVELRKLNREFQKANDEAENLESTLGDLGGGFDSAGRAALGFGGDIRQTTMQMVRMAQVARTVIPPLMTLRNVFRNFHNSRFNGGFAVLDSMFRSGVIVAGLGMLTQRLLGVHRVMQNASGWQRNMVRFGSAITGIAGMGAFLNFVTRGRFNVLAFAKASGFAGQALINLSDKVTKLGARFGLFSITSAKAFIKLSDGLEKAGQGIVKLFDLTTGLGQGMFKLATGAASVGLGFAMMKNGMAGLAERFKGMGWWAKIFVASLAAIATIGPAAMEVLGKSLIWVSNLFVGLVDSVKQLSGGFLALPGFISMIIASVSTLGFAFKGLSDKFKDIFSDDPIKATAAMMMLPPHLRALGQALQALKPKFKEIQTAVQSTLFYNLEKDIKSLSGTYLPLLQRGMVTVANSMRRAKNEFVGFLNQDQTQRDTSAIYNATAQAMEHLGRAIQPAAEGMRDLVTVGAQFIAEWTGGLPRVAQKFAEWAAVNRQNGNLLKWMRESWQGVKDLTKGIVDASKAVGTLFGLFATNNGDNALERFAKSMKNFNDTVQRSAASGTLRDIGDAVRNLGTDSIEKFKDVMRSVMDAVKAAIPVIKDISEYASKVLVPAFKFAAQVVETFFDIINSSGLAPFIGVLTSIVTLLLAVTKAAGPIKNIIQVVGGAFVVFKGVPKLIQGAVDVLYYFGPAGKAASTAITGVGKALRGLGTAAIIVGTVWSVFKQGSEEVKQASKNIDDALNKNVENFQKLQRAFSQDIASGKLGKTSIDAITENTKANFDQLEEIAGQAPSILAHITNALTGPLDGKKSGADGGFFSGWGQSEDFNRIQAMTDAAQKALRGFKELGITQEEVNRALSGSDGEYERLYNDLMLAGEGTSAYAENARAAAETLKGWNDQLKKAADNAATLGEGGFEIIDGIKEIANAAGDANAKLSGLEKILEKLGIVKTSSMEAAADYAQGLRDLTKNAQEAIVPGENLNQLIDAQTGKLNLNLQSGINLSNMLTGLSQEYKNAITNGTDAGTAYADFGTRIDQVADQINNAAGGIVITKEKLRELAQEAGVFDPKALSDKLNQFLNDPEKKKIILDADVNSATLENLKKELAGVFDGVSMTEQNGLHGGYADRARAAAKASKEKSAEEFKAYAEELSKTLNAQADAAKESGKSLSENFAKGIGENIDAVRKAAEDVAKAAADKLPGSPAKSGPLSGSGWSFIRGKALTRDFGRGILRTIGQVEGAATQVAGAASDGLSQTSMGFGGGRPGDQAGKFFGDILELTSFASQVTEIFRKVTDTVLKAVKFISDPMGKGKFFGQNLGFKRVASSAELAKMRADAEQAAMTSVYDSGTRPDNRDLYGMQKIAGPGMLQRDASPADIQAAIVAEGQRRGLSREAIIAALATAGHESNYGQNIIGEGQGAFLPGGGKGTAYGVFQQTPEGGWGTPEQLTDPNYAIQKFYDAYVQRLATNPDPIEAAVLTQNPQLQGRVNGQDYTNKTIAQIADAAKALDQVLRSGSMLPTQTNMVLPGIPALGLGGLKSTKLQDQDGLVSKPWVQRAAAILEQLFPNINSIGGARNDPLPNHPNGLALDIGIGEVTPENQLIGDMVNAYVRQNAQALGVKSTIWRDTWMDFNGNTSTEKGHQNHVHIEFSDNGVMNIGPNGTNLTMPFGIQSLVPESIFGPPNEPDMTSAPPGEKIVFGPDGKPQRVHDGSQAPPGEKWDIATGGPWTEERRRQYFEQNLKQFELGDLSMEEFQALYDNPEIVKGTSNELLNQLKQDARVSTAYELQKRLQLNPQAASEAQITQTLTDIDNVIAELEANDTAQNRSYISQLQSVQSSIMGSSGFAREANPIDTITTIASNIAGVTSDIIGTIVSGIEAVGATDDIAKTMVRGVQNTKDIDRVIDNVQKFIAFGADIAGSVASVSGLISSIVGAGSGADPSGGAAGVTAALSSISTIASLVQAGFETTNAIIDLTQEAMRIAGTYVGDFLGYLVGGAGGQLTGNVRFLLDQQTNQLMAYTAENAMDKRIHNVPFAPRDMASRDQLIGNINVYGGPGSDPRDLTRQMMFQVNSAQYAGALAQ